MLLLIAIITCEVVTIRLRQPRRIKYVGHNKHILLHPAAIARPDVRPHTTQQLQGAKGTCCYPCKADSQRGNSSTVYATKKKYAYQQGTVCTLLKCLLKMSHTLLLVTL
jgi:hypothetical protein